MSEMTTLHKRKILNGVKFERTSHSIYNQCSKLLQILIAQTMSLFTTSTASHEKLTQFYTPKFTQNQILLLKKYVVNSPTIKEN